MLTTEELGRLNELVGQAKAILNGPGTTETNPDAAHRRVTELLEEGIRLCRAPEEGDARGNGLPDGGDGGVMHRAHEPSKPEA